MGLEQGAKSPSGEQSSRSATQPPSRRLPWFVDRLSLRELAFRTGTAFLTLTGLAGINPPDYSPFNFSSRTAFAQAFTPIELPGVNKEQLLSDAVTQWSTAAVNEPALGELFELTGTGTQLTGVFSDEQGDSVLFPSMLVTRYNNGKIGIRPLLTEVEGKGIDPSMNPPFFGDAAPRNGVFTVNPSPRVIEMAAALGRVLGLSNAQITRAERKGAGGYNSFVIGNNDGDYFGLVEYTSRELAGTIRMANYDTLALQAGLVPQDAMLQQGELAQGGGGPASPDAETSAAEYRSSNGNLVIKKDTGIYPAFSDALDRIAGTYADTGLKFIIVLDPDLPWEDGDQRKSDATWAQNTCTIAGLRPLTPAWNSGDCYNPNKVFFASKPFQIGPKEWELHVNWFNTPQFPEKEALQAFKKDLNRGDVGSRIGLAVTPDDINSDQARQIKMALEYLMGLDATPPGKIP